MTMKFRAAYFNGIAFHMRAGVKLAFCQHFGLSEKTFGKKLSGNKRCIVTMMELKFLEDLALVPSTPAQVTTLQTQPAL